VSSDARKGTLTLERNEMDGLMHLKWTPRGGNQTGGNDDRSEDDIIVFPADGVIKRVTTPVTADRIYLVKLNSTPHFRRMFWMQVSRHLLYLHNIQYNDALIACLNRKSPMTKTKRELIN
jgi:hypothetical protein